MMMMMLLSMTEFEIQGILEAGTPPISRRRRGSTATEPVPTISTTVVHSVLIP